MDKTRNSWTHHLQNMGVKPYIVALMKRHGRNFNKCELCEGAIPNGKHEIHHTKYAGATYYDLKIVCRKCNRKKENKNLA